MSFISLLKLPERLCKVHKGRTRSVLVQECGDALEFLARQKDVRLVWVPRHMGIPGNETANQLSRVKGTLSGTGIILEISRRSINGPSAGAWLLNLSSAQLTGPKTPPLDRQREEYHLWISRLWIKYNFEKVTTWAKFTETKEINPDDLDSLDMYYLICYLLSHAMSLNDDVPNDGSSSESENSLETRNFCSLCKRAVKNIVQCKRCKAIFHPGCMLNANKAQNRTCTHEVADRQDTIEKLMLEIRYLKNVKKEQDGRIETLQENATQEPSTSSSNKEIQENMEDTDNESVQKERDEEWQVKVKRKNVINRNKKALLYGTSVDTDNIKGIPRKKWFFVSRLDPHMTDQLLKEAIKKKCIEDPTADVVVEKLDVFHKFQSAFKVGIPINLEEMAKNPNFWPLDSKVNTFNFFLQRRKGNLNR
ncbi:hypothetical protein NQ315_000573 [Exocentrus adspersus]|uniref:RNase H type-1 domain-containing protein n=1 Tax=Exocentrus adspersus TaxID=1586481 RepID=A0AAV8VGR7_9CUCU|nr:hypothetical protein NQ315_000573 [Exocentrus adspersus]